MCISILTYILLGIADYSISRRISAFSHPSTKNRWNLKSTQHKHILARTGHWKITDEINGFPATRIVFILRKTHMIILLYSSSICISAGCSCSLLKKCMFKWIFNSQCSFQSWICDIFHFSGKRIWHQVHNWKLIATINLSKISAETNL